MIEQLKTFLDTLAITFDFPILEFIRNNIKATLPFLDNVMPYISLFGEWGAFWIAVAAILLLFRKTRKTGLSMGVAMLLGVIICNVILKRAVVRPRPFDYYALPEVIARIREAGVPILNDGFPKSSSEAGWIVSSSDFSFPSGHTICCFEAATVLMVKNKWAGIPAMILAFLVAFSRLYLYVHYPTDVIFSMFAGILLGLLGCAIVAIIYKVRPPKRGKYERVNQQAS